MKTSIVLAIGLTIGSVTISQALPTETISPIATQVKVPAGVDPQLTSTDPKYGYSPNQPIEVGAEDEDGSPAAEYAYLNMLRDEAGNPVAFKRRGSIAESADGHILDRYDVVTSTDRQLTLYLDMYHPKNSPKQQLAPKGLFKAK